MNVAFYKENSYELSKIITKRYSTSFTLATSLLKKEKRRAIYAIYGFVRLADEIVDSFHGYDKSFLLNKLDDDLSYALENGISTNSVLTAFADTANNYAIARKHIDAFMDSMRADLIKSDYKKTEDLEQYIYGSADVVGLMCLKVFCDGNQALYEKLEYPAQKLGSAFQKVNFMRDLKDDINELGRSYFPEITKNTLNDQTKRLIEENIEEDFADAWIGIKQLPGRSKLAVALAYFYYKSLLNKIKRTKPEKLLSTRIRISNIRKYFIILKVAFIYKIKLKRTFLPTPMVAEFKSA